MSQAATLVPHVGPPTGETAIDEAFDEGYPPVGRVRRSLDPRETRSLSLERDVAA